MRGMHPPRFSQSLCIHLALFFVSPQPARQRTLGSFGRLFRIQKGHTCSKLHPPVDLILLSPAASVHASAIDIDGQISMRRALG